MFKHITKRDGTTAAFDAEKITRAIARAGRAANEFDEAAAALLTRRVLEQAQQRWGEKTPGVEDIQDVVEEVLLSSPHHKTAKAYILYRAQHAALREIVARADVDLVDQYLEQLDWQVRENSNMTYSLQGLNNYIASEISKIYWLNKIYPPEIKQAQVEGDFHIHDLNALSVYCVGWDLSDLLLQGFKGAPGKVESRPAKHFRSALGQVVNFFYTLQGEAAGAQAFSNFDTLLSPFIRYDGLAYAEVKQEGDAADGVFTFPIPTYNITRNFDWDNPNLDGLWRWKNHFSTIGLVGMNEACLNLPGENIAGSKGHAFALRTLEYMRARTRKNSRNSSVSTKSGSKTAPSLFTPTPPSRAGLYRHGHQGAAGKIPRRH